VNDLAMAGALPRWISLALILEEGLPVADLERVLDSTAVRARQAHVQVVCGDTKVVPKGAADRIFINTAGIGVVPDRVAVSRRNARPGDRLVLSGVLGLHGLAVMLSRGNLSLRTPLVSDVAPLNDIVAALLQGGIEVHALRDLTRGGLTMALHDMAAGSGVTMEVDEQAIPADERRPPPVNSSALTRCTLPARDASWPPSRPNRPSAPWRSCVASRSPSKQRSWDTFGRRAATHRTRHTHRHPPGPHPSHRRTDAAHLLTTNVSDTIHNIWAGTGIRKGCAAHPRSKRVHEFSIAEAIVETIERTVGRTRPVLSATVTIGLLSGVNPESLQFCFPIVAEQRGCGRPELKVNAPPAALRCRACRAEHESRKLAEPCPKCGSLDREVLTGMELTLDSVEVAEE